MRYAPACVTTISNSEPASRRRTIDPRWLETPMIPTPQTMPIRAWHSPGRIHPARRLWRRDLATTHDRQRSL